MLIGRNEWRDTSFSYGFWDKYIFLIFNFFLIFPLFPQKRPNRHIFKVTWPKMKFSLQILFFPKMIRKFCLFRSSASCFWDKHFLRKNGRIGSFSRSHDQKLNFSLRYFFFLRWSENFVCFALALPISEISIFSAKTAESTVFQGHTTKN